MKIQNLRFQIKERVLLSDLNFEVIPGEVLAIIGPNGAGKSTLLKCLSGDLTTFSGTIELLGQNLKALRPTQQAHIRAVLPQNIQMDFSYPVKDIVEMPFNARIGSEKSTQLRQQALTMMDMLGFEKRDYLTLSGGEQQRVQLARVFAQLLAMNSPERYLLLDECTSSLDLSHQHCVFHQTRQLAKEHNVGVVVIVHDLNLAAQYADRVLLMNQGELITLDTPEKVLTNEHIESVYHYPVLIQTHPQGWPMVLPNPSLDKISQT